MCISTSSARRLTVVAMIGMAAWTGPIVTAQPAEGGKDVAEIVRLADEATKALSKVTFDFTFSARGRWVKVSPTIRGTTTLQKVTDPSDSLVKVDAFITAPPAMNGDVADNEEMNVQFARDKEKAYILDKSDERFIYGSAGELWPRLDEMVQRTVMFEFLHPSPFNDEMNADSLKLEGEKEVGGVQCDVVYVVYSGGMAEARWFFGQADHLPRCVERIQREGDQEDAMIITISSLNTKPEFEESVFALAAPEGYASEEFKAPDPNEMAAEEPALLEVGTEAPAWELKTPTGETVSLASLKGQIVVMDFWATWCGPCKMAMPGVQAIHEHFQGKPVKVFGVNTWENEDGEPAKYMADNKYTYGLLLGGDDVAKAYMVTGIPTFYVIGVDGKILHVSVGADPEGEKLITELIEKALADVKPEQ